MTRSNSKRLRRGSSSSRLCLHDDDNDDSTSLPNPRSNNNNKTIVVRSFSSHVTMLVLLSVWSYCLVGNVAWLADAFVPSTTTRTTPSVPITTTSTTNFFQNYEKSPSKLGLISSTNRLSSSLSRTRTRGGSSSSSSSSTKLQMFMGSDGGILGVGAPELFTILLVGYFVLGPSDLYKLVKEAGKFIQNFRTFTTEATQQLENNLESNLQLAEIRKAQQELNDAFSFRRSINVDSDSAPFEINVQTPRRGEVTAAAVAATETTAAGTATAGADGSTVPVKKKIRRRRVKKKVSTEADPSFVEDSSSSTTSSSVVSNVPDLDVEKDSLWDAEESAMAAMEKANEELRLEMEKEREEEAAAERRKERIERLSTGTQKSKPSDPYAEYYDAYTKKSTSSTEDELAEQELAASAGQYDTAVTGGSNDHKEKGGVPNADDVAAASARFQSQLSGNWNDSILAKESDLAPLATVMEKIKLLEEEKIAADKRLQEEFKRREANEEEYYREKRKLLENAASFIQEQANNNDGTAAAKDSSSVSSSATSK